MVITKKHISQFSNSHSKNDVFLKRCFLKRCFLYYRYLAFADWTFLSTVTFDRNWLDNVYSKWMTDTTSGTRTTPLPTLREHSFLPEEPSTLFTIFQTRSRIAIDFLSINEELCVATSAEISNAFGFGELLAGRCATRVIHTVHDVFITRTLARTGAFTVHFDLCAICFAWVSISQIVNATDRVENCGTNARLFARTLFLASYFHSSTLRQTLIRISCFINSAHGFLDLRTRATWKTM